MVLMKIDPPSLSIAAEIASPGLLSKHQNKATQFAIPIVHDNMKKSTRFQVGHLQLLENLMGNELEIDKDTLYLSLIHI